MVYCPKNIDMTLRRAPLLLVSFGFLAASPQAPKTSPASGGADQTASSPTTNSQAPANPTTDKITKTGAATISATIPVQTPDVGGDIILCQFSQTDLQRLKTPDLAPTLTSANEDEMKNAILSAAQATLSTADLTKLSNDLAAATLAGRTPSQALNTVLDLLNKGNIGHTSPTPAESNTAKLLKPIVDAARQSLARIIRPDDVACAMSILDYDETRKAYGYNIAQEYIAVQVNIRNLNPNQPFVLHNIQFGVASGMDRSTRQYFSGRDKVIVRSLSEAQQWSDPRNVSVHLAYAAGAIASAVVPFAGPTLGIATAVYNGAFVTNLDKYLQDQSGVQLNLLNDTAFSSASSSQTIIGKSSTEIRVIFLPSKQFSQAWWTQPCTDYVAVGLQSNERIVAVGSKSGKTLPYGVASDDEVYRSAEACADYAQRHSSDVLNNTQQPQSGTPGEESHDDEGSGAFVKARRVKFSKWSGNALAIFRDLSATLVSGTHVVEETDLQASLTQIVCPTDSNGDLSLGSNPPPSAGDGSTKPANTTAQDKGPAAQSANPTGNSTETTPPGGTNAAEANSSRTSGATTPTDAPSASSTGSTDTISCQLIGKNLYQFAKIRLRNDKDPADSNTVEGEVTISGGSGTGSVKFKVSDIEGLEGSAYDVFGITQQGVEQKTTQVINKTQKGKPAAPSNPNSATITNVDPPTLSLAAGSQTVTVNGTGLKESKILRLTDPNNASTDFDLAMTPAPNDTKVSFTFDPSKFMSQPKMDTDFNLVLLSSDKKSLAKAPDPFHVKVAASGAQKPVQPSSNGGGQKRNPPKK